MDAPPQPNLLGRAVEWGRQNVIGPLGDAWNGAAAGARTMSRSVIVGVTPFDGFDELKQVCFLSGDCGVYDLAGYRVHAERGDPPARVPAWRLRLDTTPGGGIGIPGRTPGGAPIRMPVPIRIP